eukprot:3861192-Rhodomonas_salina.1
MNGVWHRNGQTVEDWHPVCLEVYNHVHIGVAVHGTERSYGGGIYEQVPRAHGQLDHWYSVPVGAFSFVFARRLVQDGAKPDGDLGAGHAYGFTITGNDRHQVA